MRIAAATALGVILISTGAFAQDELARKQAVEVAARVPLEKATTGAPYSAETLVEGVQPLADGNRILRKTTGRVYRDSEGRTRREEDGGAKSLAVAGGALTATLRTQISIVDPVGGYSYLLDPERKIAWRTTIGATAAILNKIEAATAEDAAKRTMLERLRVTAARAADAGPSKTPDEQKALEEEKRSAAVAAGARGGGVAAGGVGGGGGGGGSMARMRGEAFTMDKPGPLEHKVLEGVAVEGRKTTVTIPAGQVGNEQPLTITSEEWRSTELNVLVMTRYSDPRSGESSYRLINIIRAEPDRSLFMVPADYEIRESGVRRMQQ